MIALTLALTLAAPAPSWSNPAADDLLQLRAVTACVVARTPKTAQRVLDGYFTPGTPRGQLQELLFRRGDCLPRGKRLMAASGLLLSGSLAESVMRTLPTGHVADRLALPPEQTVVAAVNETEMTALCLVRRGPGETQALLAAPVASEAETVALKPLIANLPGCLATGVTGRFNKPSLRALVALATYRIVQLGGVVEKAG